MSDLVGNSEDRFSHDATHIEVDAKEGKSKLCVKQSNWRTDKYMIIFSSVYILTSLKAWSHRATDM